MDIMKFYRIIDADQNKTIKITNTREEARTFKRTYDGRTFIERVTVTNYATEKIN